MPATARKFCYLCATKLEQRSEYSWYCPSCQYTQYESPKPAGEIILHRDGKILIAERGNEPDKGTFDFPGGFIEANETFEQGIIREAEEELGVTEDQLGAMSRLSSFTSTYAYGKEVYGLVVEVYFAELKTDMSLVAKDDVASVRWITQSDVEAISWARDSHRQNALQAFERIG